MAHPKTPKKPRKNRQTEFQSRLSADPASTLAKVGVELLDHEVEKIRSSLKALIERSVQMQGAATLEHKITQEHDKSTMIVVVGVTIKERNPDR